MEKRMTVAMRRFYCSHQTTVIDNGNFKAVNINSELKVKGHNKETQRKNKKDDLHELQMEG